MGEEFEFGGGARGGFTGDVEEGLDFSAAVGDGDDHLGDFVKEAGVEERAVDGAAALDHGFFQVESAGEFMQGLGEVDGGLAAEEVGDAGGLEVGEIGVGDLVAEEQNDVIAGDFGTFPVSLAATIDADGKRFGARVGDEIMAGNFATRGLEVESVGTEFLERGRADNPGADAITGGGGFEKLDAAFGPGKFAPAIRHDPAIDGRAHVADEIGFHGGDDRRRPYSCVHFKNA